MAVSPVLVVKIIDDSAVGVRARLYDDFVEHEIVLNSVITYWWTNNDPVATKFLELFESVIKRTINELMPHKNLNLKYSVKADNELDKASSIEINLIEVEADGTGFKIDGKKLILNGLTKTDDDFESEEFFETFEKSIETPDIILKKYKQMQEK
ncbi:MAG: hypothetical protein IKE95_09340 [Methanobrevibacter sp.]|nr:hypothetical protein [Methanobrevibacter sp.]